MIAGLVCTLLAFSDVSEVAPKELLTFTFEVVEKTENHAPSDSCELLEPTGERVAFWLQMDIEPAQPFSEKIKIGAQVLSVSGDVTSPVNGEAKLQIKAAFERDDRLSSAMTSVTLSLAKPLIVSRFSSVQTNSGRVILTSEEFRVTLTQKVPCVCVARNGNHSFRRSASERKGEEALPQVPKQHEI